MIATTRNLRAQLVEHADLGACLPTIAGYIVCLPERLLDAAEHSVAVLASSDDASDGSEWPVLLARPRG